MTSWQLTLANDWVFYYVKEYLGQSGLTIALKSFARPICEYGNIFMGAYATHLHKLDSIQKMVERLCGTTFCHWPLVVRPAPLACCVVKLVSKTSSEFLSRPYFCYTRLFLLPCHE